MLAYKILDDTLKAINIIAAESPKPYFEIFSSYAELQQVSNRDQKSILDKLTREGFIGIILSDPEIHKNHIKGTELYFITFDGLVLLQEGGYEGKFEKEKLLKDRTTFLEDSSLETSIILTGLNSKIVCLTVWIALGTVFGTIFSGLSVYKTFTNSPSQTKESLQFMKGSDSLKDTIPKHIKPESIIKK